MILNTAAAAGCPNVSKYEPLGKTRLAEQIFFEPGKKEILRTLEEGRYHSGVL